MISAEKNIKNELAAIKELTFDKEGFLKKKTWITLAESLNNRLIDESINAFNMTPSQKEKRAIALRLRDYINVCHRTDRLKLNQLSLFKNFIQLLEASIKPLFYCSGFLVALLVVWPLPASLCLFSPFIIIPALLWFKQRLNYRLVKSKKIKTTQKLIEIIDSSDRQERSIQFPDIAKNNTLFKECPPVKIDISNLPSLTENDLIEKLACICNSEDDAVNPFVKHIGPNSTYNQKENLLAALQPVYYRLNGDLDKTLGPLSEKEMLIYKLLEDIDKCTPGFHNRVNTILESFQNPQTFDELLYQIRKNLVEKAAIKQTDDVHDANQFTIIANKEGYGIRPNFANDIYPGDVKKETIRQILGSEFKNNYTLFQIPVLLVDALKGILNAVGYTGLKEISNSYTSNGFDSETEKFTRLINRYLGINENFDWTLFFIINEDFLILDVNWKLIKQCFFNKLLKEKYFNLDKSVNYLMLATFFQPELLESILQSSELSVSNEKTLQQLFLEKNKQDWNCLKLAVSYQPKSLKIFLDLARKNLPNFLEEKTLLSLLQEKDKLGWNSFMLAARNQPDSFDALLNFASAQTNNLDNQLLTTLLLEKNNRSWNSLMIAARHQPAGLALFLKFITKHIDSFDKETLRTLFLEKNDHGWNVLMLSAKYQPESFEMLLNVINQHGFFDKHALHSLLAEQIGKDDLNLFTLVAKYQPTSLKKLLDFIAKQPDQFAEKILTSLILDNNASAWNSLKLAARYQPNSFEFLFDALVQKIHPANSHNLPNLFLDLLLEKTANGWNCWMLGAHYQPQVAKKIVAFIKSNISQLDRSTIQEIFLEKNSLGKNSFVAAAKYQPEAALLILNFITEHPGIFKPEISEQIIQKNLTQLQQGLLNLMAIKLDKEQQSTLLKFISLYPDVLTHKKKLADFIFKALAVIDDKQLIENVIASHATLLLNCFSVDYFKSDTKNLAFITGKLLETYSTELNTRKNNNIITTHTLFKHHFGYSTDEKLQALNHVKGIFDNSPFFERNQKLKALTYPALANGRLSQLFKASHYSDVITKEIKIEFNR